MIHLTDAQVVTLIQKQHLCWADREDDVSSWSHFLTQHISRDACLAKLRLYLVVPLSSSHLVVFSDVSYNRVVTLCMCITTLPDEAMYASTQPTHEK